LQNCVALRSIARKWPRIAIPRILSQPRLAA
jgi:hypothetical protein